MDSSGAGPGAGSGAGGGFGAVAVAYRKWHMNICYSNVRVTVTVRLGVQ